MTMDIETPEYIQTFLFIICLLRYILKCAYHGLNEHTNGLIRQFFPKDTNFKPVKPEEFQRVVDLINNRPRKSLDYRTPYEVFCSISVDWVALMLWLKLLFAVP
jgi:hypothetical protein